MHACVNGYSPNFPPQSESQALPHIHFSNFPPTKFLFLSKPRNFNQKLLIMTKMEALRRFFLPCLRDTAAASPSTSPPEAASKKRLSSSLRDDLDDNVKPRITNQENSQERSSSSSSSTSPTTTIVPPRSSRTMVIGTIFGHGRGGHIFFCMQQDRLSSKPALFLQLSIPISTLIHEMRCGVARIALEFNAADSADSRLRNCPLRSIPLWTLYCNGRKLGFAVRRRATQQNKGMLKTMRSITVGAGVIPDFGTGSSSGEIMYMRANYEWVVGNADSESFHLINPDEGPGQELSFFLMRSR